MYYKFCAAVHATLFFNWNICFVRMQPIFTSTLDINAVLFMAIMIWMQTIAGIIVFFCCCCLKWFCFLVQKKKKQEKNPLNYAIKMQKRRNRVLLVSKGIEKNIHQNFIANMLIAFNWPKTNVLSSFWIICFMHLLCVQMAHNIQAKQWNQCHQAIIFKFKNGKNNQWKEKQKLYWLFTKDNNSER